MNLTFRDLDELKNHLSSAVVKDVQDKIGPLVDKLEGVVARIPPIESDVKQLKSNQAKALVGWSVLVTGITLLSSHTWAWISSRFNTHQ